MRYDNNPTYPVLPAYEVADPGDEHPQWVAWCPWCEAIHRHGAGEGHRVAHCHEATSATNQRGYVLKKVGEVASEDEVRPKRFRSFRGRLALRMIEREGRHLRAAALRALLPITAAESRYDCFVRVIDPLARLIVFDDEWKIEETGKEEAVRGRGLLSMGQTLLGVSAGVLAVRFLEALACRTFDDATAQATVVLIDAWTAAGSPDRWGRK